MTVVATIEARMGSSRLPGKILMPAGGEPLLGILINRLKVVSQIDQIVIATTTAPADEAILSVAERYGVETFRGSEEDVLQRVAEALSHYQASVCVEITSDCPLLDPRLVSAMIDEYLATSADNLYIGNTTGPAPGAPNGQDIQVFSAAALHEAAEKAQDPADREHVSSYLYRNVERFRPRFVQQIPVEIARRICVTLDYREDYELIRAAHEAIDEPQFGLGKLIAFCDEHPELSLPCLTRRGLDSRGFPTAERAAQMTSS